MNVKTIVVELNYVINSVPLLLYGIFMAMLYKSYIKTKLFKKLGEWEKKYIFHR